MSHVEVYAAKIPFIGWIAVHCWLVVDGRDRFEVWQTPGARLDAVGHLHRNLMAPQSGVGNGPAWRLARLEGGDALTVAARLYRAHEIYPYCARYAYWPGPNSNTFAQWALGSTFRLPWRAIGRGFPCESSLREQSSGSRLERPSNAPKCSRSANQGDD